MFYDILTLQNNYFKNLLIMKKFKAFIFVSIFLLGILSLSSCYTKKKGIVPCPSHGYNNVDIENVDAIPLERV